MANDNSQQNENYSVENDLDNIFNRFKQNLDKFYKSKKILGHFNKEKRAVQFIGIFVLLSILFIFLMVAILFSFLPTSIFGESSDLNHDQRDEIIKTVSNYEGLDFATTNEGLINAISTYKASWRGSINALLEENHINSVNGLKIEENELELICQIVAQEAGDTYTGALAVANCVVNRISEGVWKNSWDREMSLKSNTSEVSDPLNILTAKGQFEAYISNDYKHYENNIPEQVKAAVIDCFEKGKRIHNYTQFRSYETTGSIEIEGNYYFDFYDGDTSNIAYVINKNTAPINFETVISENSIENFINSDPYGTKNWDLIYLITAYDASKKNLEEEILDTDGNHLTRYDDLINGIGEYILKAIFGTEIETVTTEPEQITYPLYEEISVTVIENNTVKRKQLYRQVGEATTTVKLVIPVYSPQEDLVSIEEELPEGLVGTLINQDNNLIFEYDNQKVKANSDIKFYEKTDQVQELVPKEIEVTETKRVYGLQKSVLLSVLDLNPSDSYKVLEQVDNGSITNSDYIEYSRFSTIKMLSLNETNFSEQLDSEDVINGVGGSQLGWIWPLDPNGYGSFIITSLMGTRESPGGIGSTDHGGTDIGAAHGVAILAAQDGIVEVANSYGGYGNAVRINHGIQSDGKDYQTLYGHMSVIACSVGQSVKKGQIIGYVGSTGWSTGPHLHYEVICNGSKINGLSMYDQTIIDKLIYYL